VCTVHRGIAVREVPSANRRREMKHRLSTSASFVVVVAGLVLSPMPISGQTQGTRAAPARATAKKAGPGRTPWGDPDLQGVWNDATGTPLQRPNGLAGKDVLSDEEAAAFQEQTVQDLTRDRRDGGNAA